jgi:DNA repair protein RecN (Recombination protein N)
MLEELSIRNFAIIDDLSIRFGEGLTILSGETGAGKSILINAVNLLLGSRASTTLIRTGAESAELEALFRISPSTNITRLMSEQGYDPLEGLLVRRIISRKDTNRIYINGRMASMQLLDALTENLASISGQHAHQGLLKEDQHLLILDQFGGLLELRSQFSKQYNALIPLLQHLERLVARQTHQSEQIELMQFQKQEIISAAIQPQEDIELEQEQRRLKHAARLHQVCFNAIEEIYGRQGAVIERLGELKKELKEAGRIDAAFMAQAETLEDITFRLEDIAGELRQHSQSIDNDPGRLERVEERLDLLNRLKRKYGGSLEAVQDHLETVNQALEGLENLADRIQETEAQIEEQHLHLAKLAVQLSEQRGAAAKRLSQIVVSELAELKMENTGFEVSLNRQAADNATPACLKVNDQVMTETGLDRASFMIAPNVGEMLKPLTSIASGGELSRVILAIKAILAQTDSVETIIFDEVDAGIGGGVAEQVGEKLAQLGEHHQVICITHLPQIAKFGRHHYHISKRISGGRTHTVIHHLDEAARLKEIARMLGGADITAATLAHARELLERPAGKDKPVPTK